MLNVIENLLSDEIANSLESIFLSNRFPWYLNYTTASKYSENTFVDGKTFEGPQFIHNIIDGGVVNSDYLKNISDILLAFRKSTGFPSNRLARIKANLTYPLRDAPIGSYRTPHLDYKDDSKEIITAIYYVNDSDGDTLLFDNDMNITHRFTPKKNSMLWFDHQTIHAAENQIVSPTRCVINFNFIVR